MLSDHFQISVKTFRFLEPILAEELKELGAVDIEIGRRIVHCKGDLKLLYNANYQLRTALRVLIPIFSFPLRHGDELYRRAVKMDWTKYINRNQTFAIDAQVNSELFNHSHFASIRLKDAIADSFTQQFGSRPDVDRDHPDVLLHLHIDNDKATIALDSSGSTLNQRGYRKDGGQAPLNEVLAAAMIKLSGWDGVSDFYDPMCGSGTLPIEAALFSQNIPVQIFRREFGFMNWKNFDEMLWRDVKDEANNSERRRTTPRIFASDADSKQLSIAKRNVSGKHELKNILLMHSDFFELSPEGESGLLMMNPPYGERMDEQQIILLYQRIGQTFKHQWPGFQAWLISSDVNALKQVGLKPSRRIELMNGPFECKFYRFDLYKGSKRRGDNTSQEAAFPDE